MRPRSYHLVVMVTVPSMSWSVTYIAMDKIQTACQCRSQWWFHTRAIHLSAQRWCSRRTTCFQTWTEMRRWLRLHCPARSTWLWGHRGLHLEWEWPVSVRWLHTAPWVSCSYSSDQLQHEFRNNSSPTPFPITFWNGLCSFLWGNTVKSSCDTSFNFCLSSKAGRVYPFLLARSIVSISL